MGRALGAGNPDVDRRLMEELGAAVRAAAPTDAADELYQHWYHTVDLGNGLHTTATYDLRSTVDQHGLPESMEGMTALDVGTCDGFWAFEMERRGAERVVATDIERYGDFDLLPWVREAMGEGAGLPMDQRFWIAHALRGSRVEHKACSVYDLSPETVGTFDLVFCGSLLLHLLNPLQALVAIRSVTGGRAIVASLRSEEIEDAAPGAPWISFGHRGGDMATKRRPMLGAQAIYWRVSTAALRELMEYAGFARTEALDPVPMPPTPARCAVVIGHPDPEA